LRRKRAVLIDSNEELINCYDAVKNDPERLIRALGNRRFKNDEEAYRRIRAEGPVEAFEGAARMIYLNKTCFNGLYRVNRKGEFNVPFGRYKNPRIRDEENLRAASIALRSAEILAGDFSECLELAKKGDFVYFDPPYQPLTKTSSFTSYTRSSFNEAEQRRLSEVFRELDRLGCRVMLSNSHTNLVRDLYAGYRLERVLAKRAINCKGTGRGAIREYLVLNF
jgi:DNA adenine methylase